MNGSGRKRDTLLFKLEGVCRLLKIWVRQCFVSSTIEGGWVDQGDYFYSEPTGPASWPSPPKDEMDSLGTDTLQREVGEEACLERRKASPTRPFIGRHDYRRTKGSTHIAVVPKESPEEVHAHHHIKMSPQSGIAKGFVVGATWLCPHVAMQTGPEVRHGHHGAPRCQALTLVWSTVCSQLELTTAGRLNGYPSELHLEKGRDQVRNNKFSTTQQMEARAKQDEAPLTTFVLLVTCGPGCCCPCRGIRGPQALRKWAKA